MFRNLKFRFAPTAFFFALTFGALALANPATASAQSISGERALLGVDRSLAAPAAFESRSNDSITVDPRYPTGAQALLGRSPQGDRATAVSTSQDRVAQKNVKIDGPRALLGRATPRANRPAEALLDRRER